MGYILILAAITVSLTISIHYYSLRALYHALGEMKTGSSFSVGIAVHLVFLIHSIEIILFACSFYFAVELAGIGVLKGEFSGDFREYIYFSLVSYTSLGLGDVYPYGPIRLLTGVEALTGLMMIGWSASFTYFCMSKLWHKGKE